MFTFPDSPLPPCLRYSGRPGSGPFTHNRQDMLHLYQVTLFMRDQKTEGIARFEPDHPRQ